MTKSRFTLHWNCCEDSRKCRRSLKLFVGLFVDLSDSLKQGTTGNWIVTTQMLAPANSAWVCWLCWLCLCSGHYTVKHKRVLYFLDELYGNELVFAFSFVSSNNTDVETTRQYPTAHKVCLWKHLYRTLLTSSVFLLLTHDEFFDAFEGNKFHLETVCLFQRLVIGQFIRKSRFLDRLFSCWLLRKFWASSFARSVKPGE